VEESGDCNIPGNKVDDIGDSVVAILDSGGGVFFKLAGENGRLRGPMLLGN